MDILKDIPLLSLDDFAQEKLKYAVRIHKQRYWKRNGRLVIYSVMYVLLIMQHNLPIILNFILLLGWADVTTAFYVESKAKLKILEGVIEDEFNELILRKKNNICEKKAKP